MPRPYDPLDYDEYDPTTGTYRPQGLAPRNTAWSPGIGVLPTSLASRLGEEEDPYDPVADVTGPDSGGSGGRALTSFSEPKKASTLEDISAHTKRMPKQAPPKLWQRILAGAVGAGAGYLNAGGRTRVDVEPAIAGIYAGDYPRQLQNWQNEQAGLMTRAKIEQQQTEEARRKEESEAHIAAARAAEARANRPVPSAPETPGEAYERRKKEARDLNLAEGTPEYRSYVGTGRIPTPQHPATPSISEKNRQIAMRVVADAALKQGRVLDPTKMDEWPAADQAAVVAKQAEMERPSRLLSSDEFKQQVDLGRARQTAASGADITEPLGAADPTSNAILAQTGLSLKAFYALVGESSKLPRDAATRRVAMKEAEEFSRKRGIDTAMLAAQYKTYNTVLGANISRLNNTKIMESEIQGTIENLQDVVNSKDLGRLNFANVAKIWAGQQVNDPLAQQYALHLSQLRNELTAYYAATQGRSGNNILLEDRREAEGVIRNGIASGSLKGLSAAIENSTGKMGTVMQKSVDRAGRAIWDLFGVGRNYKSQSPSTSQPDTVSGKQIMVRPSKNDPNKFQRSLDGGKTWTELSTDGGKTWQPIPAR